METKVFGDQEIHKITSYNCRICLSLCKNDAEESDLYQDLYTILTGLQFDSEDLPKKICQKCVNLLNGFLEFREMCENTEKILELEKRYRINTNEQMEEVDDVKNIKIELFEMEEDVDVGDMDYIEPFSQEMLPDVLSEQDSINKKKRVYKSIACHICSASVKSNRLKAHYRHKHPELLNEQTPRYECAHCPSSYKQRSEILRHLRSKHIEDKPKFPCQYCDKIFDVWATRYYHVKQKHEKAERFICPICQKKFFLRGHYNDHISTHIGSRDFECAQCNSAFTSKKNLKRHENDVHQLGRNFVCIECNATFKNQKGLKQHQKSHEENSYICPVCRVSYTVGKSLRNHIETKHPNVQLPPPGTTLKNNLDFLTLKGLY